MQLFDIPEFTVRLYVYIKFTMKMEMYKKMF